MKRLLFIIIAMFTLNSAFSIQHSAFALTWKYYDKDNLEITNPKEEEITSLAVKRSSDTGITQFALEITHDFSGTWGTGYLENIGNPVPAAGKQWITANQKISPQVDGIVQDINNVNSRYIVTAYRAKGPPNQGLIANAIQFDGADDYISINGIALNSVDGFTIEFWARRDTPGRNECLFGQGTNAEGKGIEFGYWDGEDKARVNLPGWAFARTNSPTDTAWHQWRIEYSVDRWPHGDTSGEGFHIRIYRDDQLVNLSSGDIGDVPPACTTTQNCRAVNYTERVCRDTQETYKEGCDEKTRTVTECHDEARNRQDCWPVYNCSDRAYTGTGTIFIGKGIGASYFKGQMKDISIKINGQPVGRWQFNDGNKSAVAADSSGYNRAAVLNNFSLDTCWMVDPSIEKVYELSSIQSKQVIPEFTMLSQSSIVYGWGKQVAVNISAIPDNKSSKAYLKITDKSGQESQSGAGKFWYKLGTAMKLSSEPDDCMQLMGYRDNLSADPNKEIPNNEVMIGNLESPVGITWVYSQYIYEESVTIGNPISFSSVPLAIQQRANLAKKPLYKIDAANQTPEDQMLYWSAPENKLFPVKPDQTFLLEWEMIGECPGTKLITKITTKLPDAPHYIHIAQTPPVDLDASADDLMAFKAIKYTDGDATVSGKSFSATQPGKSVLVFTRGDTISNTEPKEIALSFNGGSGYADAGIILLNRGAFTIEFWAKRASLDFLHAAVGQGTKEPDKGLLIGFNPDNTFMFSFFGNDLKTSANYTDTDWHHWACSYEVITEGDEGECFQCVNDPSEGLCRWNENNTYTKNFTGKSVYEDGDWQWNPYYYANRCTKASKVMYKRVIYQDGVKVAEDKTEFSYKGKGSLRIGSTGEGWNPAAGFNGKIDEVRIWEISRTPEMLAQTKDSRLKGDEEGLIGYWRFDNIGESYEKDSRILADPAEKAPDATDPAEQPKMSRTCLSFNGTDTYALMKNPFSDGINFTVEMWVNPELIDGNSHALIGWQEEPNKKSPTLYVGTSGGLIWDSYKADGTRFYGTIDNFFSAYRWVHVAWVKNGTTYNFYKNGALVKTGAAPDAVQLFSRYSMGKADTYFKGQLDDIRVWNIARTEADIKANLNTSLTGNETGLAAYFPIDTLFTIDRSTVVDLTANKNNGVMMNMISSSATVLSPVPGTIALGNALSLSGKNDHVLLPGGFWFNGDFTVEAWVYARNFTKGMRLIDFSSGTGTDVVAIGLSYETNDGRVFVAMNRDASQLDRNMLQSSQSIPLNTWTHVAAAFQGTTARIYINGVEVGSKSGMIPPTNVERKLNYIGKSINMFDPTANAIFDELRIWNIARSQTQIQNAMNNLLDGSEAGLKAYYDFNQTSGTVLLDKTPAKQNGTLVNIAALPPVAASDVPAEIKDLTDYALSLDGNGDYVSFNKTLDDLKNSSFTIEFWALTQPPRLSVNVIFSLGYSTFGRVITFYDGIMSFGYYSNALQSPKKIENNTWHHWAMVYNSSLTKRIIYLDGVKVAEDTAKESYADTSSYAIGASTFTFGGQLDEFRIWKIVRSQAEIQSTMNKPLAGNEVGLVAYYDFNDSGTIVKDRTSGGRDGVLYDSGGMVERNGKKTFSIPQPAVGSSALKLDGVDDNVDLGTWFDYQTFTISLWVKPGATQVQNAVILDNNYCINSTCNNNWVLRQDSSTTNRYVWSYISRYGTENSPIYFNLSPNQWQHLAITFNGSNAKGYLNGGLAFDKTGLPTIRYDGQFLRIGNSDAKSNWNGQVDELSIWNVVKSQAEIQNMLKTPLTGAEAGLAAYYNFDQFTGSVLADKTGNHNGKLVNMAAWVDGVPALTPTTIGNAINLDGLDDYVQVPEGVWFNGDFTVEGWVYVRNYNFESRLIDFGNGPNNNNVVIPISDNESGRFSLRIFNGSTATSMSSLTPIPKNTWTHVAVTLQGKIARLYMNGVQVACKIDMAVPPNYIRKNNYIGKSNWTSDKYADAMFDELRIWSVARSQTEIQNAMSKVLAGNEAGLKLYYTFENKSFTDMSAAKTDVLNFGATSVFFTKSMYPFTTRTYMAMGGGTSYIEIPNSASLNLTSDLTVEAWINADNIADAKIAGKADQTGKKGYTLGISGTAGLNPEIWDTDGVRYNFSSGRIEPGQWTHVAMTWKKTGKLTGYINGFKVGEVSAGAKDIGITGNPFRIGAAPWDPSQFKFQGKIDDVRVWNIERSQADIKTDLMKTLTGKEPGLVAFYNFDGVQDTRLADKSLFNNKGVIIGATFIQEGLSDNVAHHPIKLVNMEPSSAWSVNTTKLYEGSASSVADKGIACVRVVETISAESDQTKTGIAIVGTELISAYHDKDVPHNGYVFREIGPYNADIYDRSSTTGSIYPVNSFHPSAIPKEDRILVVWYRMQDNIAWPYQAVDYRVEWPQNCLRVVAASRVGSEGKNKDGTEQTYPDIDGVMQNYADPQRYRDMKIYNQPNKSKPGYNPNEEHGLIAPSFRHSLTTPQPLAAFALRNDLNITTGDGFTSQPFILAQYFDLASNKHGMVAYRVEMEDPTCGYTFNYDMKAGEPVVAPYPINTVIGTSPPPEIFGKNGDPAVKCYWEDHKGQPWGISGAGKSVALASVTEKSPTEYTLKLVSGTFVQNHYYLIKVTDNTGPVGSYKFLVGGAENNRNNESVHVLNNSVSGGDTVLTVTLNPGITDLSIANFKLFDYTSNSHILSYFWYPLDPTFWINESTPGDGTGEAGKSYPFLPKGVVAAADGFPSDMTGKAKAQEIRYDVSWPDETPILKAGETLTFSGGEYQADNIYVPGLPGVLGWAAGQVVFDELNPAMDQTKLFTNYQVRLGQVLDERSVALKLDKYPDDLKPAAKRVDVLMNRYYFKDLHAGLKNRICYDPMAEKLIMRGFINGKTAGDKDLTAAPPAVYAVQPDIMTENEMNTIKALEGANADFKAAVDALYKQTRNPKAFTNKDYAIGIDNMKNFMSGFKGKTAILERLKQFFAVWLGVNADVTNLTSVPEQFYPEISFGPGLALMPNGALLDPDTAPFMNFTEGYITLAENNHPDLDALPVALHIIKVKKDKYRGAIKTIFSDNVFDEKITLRHTADFGAKADELVFQWWYREEDGTVQPTPNDAPAKWIAFPDLSGKNGQGMSEIALAGTGSALLSDNLFFVRYRHKDSPETDSASWSNWAGAANSRPPREGENAIDTYQAQLCEGWIKRVLNAVNPFEARIKNFSNTDSPATYVSMIQQAGQRYEGPVGFNPQKDVIENVGLIELYQTILERGKNLSINLPQPVCTSGVTSALMLAANRISGFYTLLGNEAYNDALDPTIGFGTSSVEYGSLAPTIFAFTNQAASLLDEELALLRGRSESGARPVYNRLIWNFTKDRGEAAYAMNYNINDVNKDGFINDADGQKLYPQGHGDAWGHYLSSVKSYYDLLRHPEFKWESRSEKFQIQGVVMDVDYFDERKFAEAAAAKAKVGKEIVDLTYRAKYVDDPDGQWQGYKDTDSARAWGVSEWTKRAFLGAYFDWAEINTILPSVGAFRLNLSDLDILKAEVPLALFQKLSTFEDQGYATQDEFKAALTAAGADPTPYPNIVKYAEKSGLKQIDRSTVQEILEIASQARNIQKQADDVNTGLNPLGLANDSVPFDIDPSRMVPGAVNAATQFEQVYERAVSALENARVIFNYANDMKNRMRQSAVSTQEFSEKVDEQDRDYRNRLIETFGTPYEGVIGPGKVYPAGYEGPDYFLYNYIDVNEVSDKTVPEPSSSFKAYFKPMNMKFSVVSSGQDDTSTGNLATMFSHYFKTDLKEGDYTSTDFSDVLEIDFPKSAGKYSYQAPASWGIRKSPGEIQMALIELVKSEADLQLALSAYDAVIGDVEGTLKLLEAKSDLRAEQIRIADAWRDKVVGFNTSMLALKSAAGSLDLAGELVDDEFQALAEGLPKVVGLAVDPSSAARGPLIGTGGALKNGLKIAGQSANIAADAIETAKDITEMDKDNAIELANYKYEIQEQLKELESVMGGERAKRLEVFKARETMRQASEHYRTILAKGLRLMEERKAFNAKVSAKTQGSRYMDMTFRLSVNNALSKYRSMFDVAARFVFLAAKAYDYETNLSDRDPASPKPLLANVMRDRTIGQYQDGQYIVGQGGLGDTLTRLKANFDTLKSQMGLNNPQNETSRMSLRYELFRIKKDSTGNESWRKELLKARTDNLWTIPEFRKYCRPFIAESAGAQPGLVISFTSNVISGKNFFGMQLGGGDHAYDPTNFATKVRSVGIWFEGYDNSLLSETPRAYLIPAGLDYMLVANSTNMDTREWTIVDQKIPVPLPVGESDLANPNWFPSLDSLNGPMVQIRKYSSSRAYHDNGYFDANQMSYDSRLIGRSVWNSRWLLIIPGATFNYDPKYGVDTFINTVTDIKMFFQTYAISGN